MDQMQGKYDGVIGIYDKTTGKMKDRIYLPAEKRMLVQNFVLLDRR